MFAYHRHRVAHTPNQNKEFLLPEDLFSSFDKITKAIIWTRSTCFLVVSVDLIPNFLD